jgi:Rha family phage regulatory protein
MADTTIGTPAANISTNIAPELTIVEGQITTTSLQIAEHFGKQHKTVLRAIRNLDAPAEFTERNFAPSDFQDSTGRSLPMFRITRDGFTLLAMGFTGKEAMQWKLAYLAAFNHMESELLARTTKPHNPAIDYDRISPAQAQELKELVQAVVDTGKQKHGETWARLHKKFRVNSYLELPAAKFAEARDYLLGKLPEPQPIPRLDTQQLQQALTASNAIAAQVQAVAFAQLLSHADAWHNERWMLAFTEGRDGQLQPYAKMLAHDAIAMPVAQIARAIATSDLQPSPADLAALLTACSAQLARHAGRQLTH